MRRKLWLTAICLCLVLAVVVLCGCSLIGSFTGGSKDTENPSNSSEKSDGNGSVGDHDHQWREQYVSLGAEGHCMMLVCAVCGEKSGEPLGPIDPHIMDGVTVKQDAFASIDNDGNVYGVTPGMAEGGCEICDYGKGGTSLYYGEPVNRDEALEVLRVAGNDAFGNINRYTYNNGGSKTTYYKDGGFWYDQYGTRENAYAIQKVAYDLAEIRSNIDNFEVTRVSAKLYQETPLDGYYYAVWSSRSDGVGNSAPGCVCVIDETRLLRMINDNYYYASVDMEQEVPSLSEKIENYDVLCAQSRSRFVDEVETLWGIYNEITVWTEDTNGNAIGTKYEWVKLSDRVLKLSTYADGAEDPVVEYLAELDGQWYAVVGGVVATDRTERSSLELKMSGYYNMWELFDTHHDEFMAMRKNAFTYCSTDWIYYEAASVNHAGYGADSYRRVTLKELNPRSNAVFNVEWKWTPRYEGDSYAEQAAPITSLMHTHTFDDNYSADDTYHWFDATCGHDIVKGKEEHTFGAWTFENTDETLIKSGAAKRTCSVCGYEDRQPLAESTVNHWKLVNGAVEREDHDYSDWETITPVRVDKNNYMLRRGERSRTCTCGEEKQEYEAVRNNATIDEIVTWFLSVAPEKNAIDSIRDKHYDPTDPMSAINAQTDNYAAGDTGFDSLVEELYFDATFATTAKTYAKYAGVLWMDGDTVVGAQFQLYNKNAYDKYEGYHYRVYVVDGEILVSRIYQYLNVYASATESTEEQHLYVLWNESGSEPTTPTSNALTGQTFVIYDIQEHDYERYDEYMAQAANYSFVFLADGKVRYDNPYQAIGGNYVLLQDGSITINLTGTYYQGNFYETGNMGSFSGTYADGRMILVDQSGDCHVIWVLEE